MRRLMLRLEALVYCAAWAVSAIALWTTLMEPAHAAEAPTITASVSQSSLPESVGAVNVRLTLESPPRVA